MPTLTAWLGRAISFALFHSPAGVKRFLAHILAFLWFDLFRIRRQVVLDNLHIAFPEMSRADRLRLGRQSLFHLAMNLLEYSYLRWITPQNYDRIFTFENSQLLEDVLTRKKGALILTLHLGHGDLGVAAMSVRGFPMVMVSKFFKLKWLNNLWFGMRERLGTRFIAPRDSSYALLKALKNGAAVIIPLDQFTGPPIGVATTFFGRKTGTAAGLAVMAERSGAPVVSAYTCRLPDGRHLIHFGREFQVEKTRSLEQVVRLTQSFNDELETFVRAHPEQWMWIHRRWKTFEVR